VETIWKTQIRSVCRKQSVSVLQQVVDIVTTELYSVKGHIKLMYRRTTYMNYFSDFVCGNSTFSATVYHLIGVNCVLLSSQSVIIRNLLLSTLGIKLTSQQDDTQQVLILTPSASGLGKLPVACSDLQPSSFASDQISSFSIAVISKIRL
jgi:hypothetical protein